MVIKTLIVEEDRPAHIAKHNVTIEEVNEVTSGDYVFIKSREDRWLVIGKNQRREIIDNCCWRT